MRTSILILLAASGCTTEASFIAGFTPPRADDGYTRFVTPTITDLEPGEDKMFCEWVQAPVEEDRQIIDTKGFQSAGGHHVALYATSEVEEVGTSRPCTIRDMLTVTFVGAVGAEGISAAKLPDGMAFGVPKGLALMSNTHYINATDKPIQAQSVVDVKFGDPQHPSKGAGNIAVNYDTFEIPAGADYTSDAYCQAKRDLSLFMWGNHMHEWGARAMSEIIRADGSKELLSKDDSWTKNQTFDPSWTRWDTATPMIVHAGDTFHVQCSWANTTANPLEFPDEMCVSTGFTLEEMPQSICEATPM